MDSGDADCEKSMANDGTTKNAGQEHGDDDDIVNADLDLREVVRRRPTTVLTSEPSR